MSLVIMGMVVLPCKLPSSHCHSSFFICKACQWFFGWYDCLAIVLKCITGADHVIVVVTAVVHIGTMFSLNWLWFEHCNTGAGNISCRWQLRFVVVDSNGSLYKQMMTSRNPCYAMYVCFVPGLVVVGYQSSVDNKNLPLFGLKRVTALFWVDLGQFIMDFCASNCDVLH